MYCVNVLVKYNLIIVLFFSVVCLNGLIVNLYGLIVGYYYNVFMFYESNLIFRFEGKFRVYIYLVCMEILFIFFVSIYLFFIEE